MTSRADHSLVRLGKSWIGRSRTPESIGRRLTSRKRLNSSNGSRAANAGFIRNQTRARSQRAGRGWKLGCESLGQNWSWQWVPQQRRQSSVRGFASRENGEKDCRPSLPQESSRRFILRLFFGSRTRNRANANTSILCRIFALHYAELAQNKTRGTAWRFPRKLSGDVAARRTSLAFLSALICAGERQAGNIPAWATNMVALPFGLSVR